MGRCPTAQVFVELTPAETKKVTTLPAAVKATTFFQGNFNFSSFILVNYTDPAQWRHITALMAKPDFPAIQRQQCANSLA